MQKNLTLKNMKETLVNYSGEQTEFDKIWDTFYQMKILGFISNDLWTKFFNTCKGWFVDEENAAVMNFGNEGYELVWAYNPDRLYTA